MELSGSCEYCGQHKMIEVEDANLTKAEVDALVTDQCDCPQAKSERRKKETADKIARYIDSEVEPQAKELVSRAVDVVRNYGADSVTVKTNDGWTIKVHLDKDAYLCFDCKKASSKKAKF